MVYEWEYEEKRDRLMDLCRTEGTDMHLHNDIVTELLLYMDGGHPAFGNIVGEIYMEVEQTRHSVFDVTLAKMQNCPYLTPSGRHWVNTL